jgi:predicted RNA-binding Zn-ribbon protein involved in translation (DUF1610 family)
MAKTYIIYCDPCGYKKVVEDPTNVGLPPFQTSSVQGRIPVLDKATNKTKKFPEVTTMPKFKCPGCGRVVTLRKLNVPKAPPPQQDDKQDEDKAE